MLASWLRNHVDHIVHSFWFLPSLMVVCAVILGELTVALDRRINLTNYGLGFLYAGGVVGARSVLSVIATAMLAVAGTVFSITIAALSIASNQMGPRILENFTRDRSNSFALGIFVATFAYALIVLRNVRGLDDGSSFVPHLGVAVAALLAFIALGVLIYFIHHISNSINVMYVIHIVRGDLRKTLETQTHPRRSNEEPVPPEPDWTQAETVHASDGGYLQAVDLDTLMRLAEQHGAVVRLKVRPGNYLFQNTVIAQISPRCFEGFERTLALGGKRTTHQDLEYAARQLVEVAARALSPGLNDPYTAISVLDHLGDALCFMQDRVLPSEAHYRAGQLRVLMPTTSFQGLTDTMFNMIRQYGASHPAVMIHMLEVLTQVAHCLPESERRIALRHHALLAYQAAMEQARAQSDQDDIEERYQQFLQVVRYSREGDSSTATQPDVGTTVRHTS